MRLRFFLLGVVVGMLCAPAGSRETLRRLRDALATTLDALLRIGLPNPQQAERRNGAL